MQTIAAPPKIFEPRKSSVGGAYLYLDNVKDAPKDAPVDSGNFRTDRTVEWADLHPVALRHPELQVLCFRGRGSEKAINALVGLDHLELLKMDSIEASESSLQSLQKLPRLHFLSLLECDADTLRSLQAALPRCEIRIGGRW